MLSDPEEPASQGFESNQVEYFKGIYLGKKLRDIKDGRSKLRLPRFEIKEVIGAQQLVIMEYISQLLLKRFQEVIRV